MSASIWTPDGNLAAPGLSSIKVDRTVAGAGQTTITLTNVTAVPGGNNVILTVNGFVWPDTEYTLSSGKLITLNSPMTGGEEIYVIGINAVVLTSSLTSAQYDSLFAEVEALATAKFNEISAAGQKFAGVEVIAHRGFVKQFPQNTLAAFSGALAAGADSLECDVQISSDGTPILYHDFTVDGSTNGTGTVTALTLAYLQGLTFDVAAGTAFEELRIPTFAEFLTFARSKAVRIYPEIKAYRTLADVDIYANAVISARMQEFCTLCSFSLVPLEYLRTINTSIKLALIGASYITDYEATFDFVASLGNSAIIWDQADIVLRPAIVDYAKSLNLELSVYTITTEQQARAVEQLGVTKIISDISLRK